MTYSYVYNNYLAHFSNCFKLLMQPEATFQCVYDQCHKSAKTQDIPEKPKTKTF